MDCDSGLYHLFPLRRFFRSLCFTCSGVGVHASLPGDPSHGEHRDAARAHLAHHLGSVEGVLCFPRVVEAAILGTVHSPGGAAGSLVHVLPLPPIHS